MNLYTIYVNTKPITFVMSFPEIKGIELLQVIIAPCFIAAPHTGGPVHQFPVRQRQDVPGTDPGFPKAGNAPNLERRYYEDPDKK